MDSSPAAAFRHQLFSRQTACAEALTFNPPGLRLSMVCALELVFNPAGLRLSMVSARELVFNPPGSRLSMVCARERAFNPPVSCLPAKPVPQKSEEHTSELQSRFDLVCRLLL